MTGTASKTGLVAAAWTVLVAGCWQSYQEAADGGEGGVVDADVHRADARADVDAADGGDVGDDDGACDGAWFDPTTGYLWEKPPSDTTRTWDDAVSYCNGLTLCGYSPGSWHLPDIDELRSLIRGCPDTVTGGACGVTDSCLDGGGTCWSDACQGCTWLGDPGAGGCYWNEALGSDCAWYWQWSSSFYAAFPAHASFVFFHLGFVGWAHKTYASYARCVHTGP